MRWGIARCLVKIYPDQIPPELKTLDTTERESRFDDKKSENSMEERKKMGYF